MSNLLLIDSNRNQISTANEKKGKGSRRTLELEYSVSQIRGILLPRDANLIYCSVKSTQLCAKGYTSSIPK
jgi:hypothetical protein